MDAAQTYNYVKGKWLCPSLLTACYFYSSQPIFTQSKLGKKAGFPSLSTSLTQIRLMKIRFRSITILYGKSMEIFKTCSNHCLEFTSRTQIQCQKATSCLRGRRLLIIWFLAAASVRVSKVVRLVVRLAYSSEIFLFRTNYSIRWIQD